MSTFMLKNSSINFTPVSNTFIEKYMPKARGEFIKVYLLLLKYITSGELGVNSTIISAKLNLLESDVMNALKYWQDEDVLRLIPIDKMGNYELKFLDLDESSQNDKNNISLLDELNNDNNKDMLSEIEKLIGRPLSPKEMTSYLSWKEDFNFSSEMVLMLIGYCVSKGKSDFRYIEKVAISWHNDNINTIDEARKCLKQNEDKWVKIRKVLGYLGIKNIDIMKPQEELLDKWLSKYNFSLEIIFKACDICFERLGRSDFKYIDGILSRWNEDNIKTLEDINNNDKAFKDKMSKGKIQNTKSKNNNLKFNNFEQRVYDYDDLERKLLGWDKDD